jgi:HAD superfamily hydrolase (TIGR01509 family)
MENYPIVHWFDEWLLSFEVGAKKPKQRIYDAIFEKMDVKPNEVFYVDDISKYVETAQQLGLHGVVFRSAAQLWDFIQKNGI